jgi:hypothetical protein
MVNRDVLVESAIASGFGTGWAFCAASACPPLRQLSFESPAFAVGDVRDGFGQTSGVRGRRRLDRDTTRARIPRPDDPQPSLTAPTTPMKTSSSSGDGRARSGASGWVKVVSVPTAYTLRRIRTTNRSK